MLTLSRRPGESIILTLPDQTTIVVELREIRGNQARIGIEAPPEVKVMRDELITPKA